MVWNNIKFLGLLLGIRNLHAQQTTEEDGLEGQSYLPPTYFQYCLACFSQNRKYMLLSQDLTKPQRGSQLNQTIVPKPSRLWWGVGGDGTQQASGTKALCRETRHMPGPLWAVREGWKRKFLQGHSIGLLKHVHDLFVLLLTCSFQLLSLIFS